MCIGMSLHLYALPQIYSLHTYAFVQECCWWVISLTSSDLKGVSTLRLAVRVGLQLEVWPKLQFRVYAIAFFRKHNKPREARSTTAALLAAQLAAPACCSAGYTTGAFWTCGQSILMRRQLGRKLEQTH
jgi:hypothetical protein